MACAAGLPPQPFRNAIREILRDRLLDSLATVLGIRVRVASLRDVTQGKLWAFGDPHRRLSKRKKDELDLIRLAEVHPELREMYPRELREQIERG